MRSKKVGFGRGVVFAVVIVVDKNDVIVAEAALSVLSFDDDSELSSSMKGTDSDSSLEPPAT